MRENGRIILSCRIQRVSKDVFFESHTKLFVAYFLQMK